MRKAKTDQAKNETIERIWGFLSYYYILFHWRENWELKLTRKKVVFKKTHSKYSQRWAHIKAKKQTYKKIIF